ncbi:MAG TPA: haloacid dehalogenase type II [Micropepsaceae bacterium]|nr:haloacid dehalogenase type II [Micropepsaceae bacterium]
MDMRPLTGIRACVFDAYGTLFDYASAAARARDVLGGDFERLTTLWRDKQLQYTWLRTIEGRHADFWQVTGDALDFALDSLGLAPEGLRDRLMNLYLKLEMFSDAAEALTNLKASGFTVAILSNGSPRMLSAMIENSRTAALFDTVLSVEEVGVFKPHPRVYQLAVDRLGVPAEAIMFSSSNAWDAFGASVFGMRVVWCNRYNHRAERLPGTPDRVVASLTQLPALLG